CRPTPTQSSGACCWTRPSDSAAVIELNRGHFKRRPARLLCRTLTRRRCALQQPENHRRDGPEEQCSRSVRHRCQPLSASISKPSIFRRHRIYVIDDQNRRHHLASLYLQPELPSQSIEKRNRTVRIRHLARLAGCLDQAGWAEVNRHVELSG